MDQQRYRKLLPTLPRHVGLLARLKRACSNVIYTWWAWEYAGAIVSIAATIALVVVLSEADQQQQRPWMIGRTQLTLNTVVAIISTVIRASLLVMTAGALNQGLWNWFARKPHEREQRPGRPLKDLELFGEAASSSWASLKLLYRTKFRYLASLGALLTILSLAFDAFTQQVLATETRPVSDPRSETNVSAKSIIPRAVSYTNVVQPGRFFLNHYPPPPLNAEAAIISGILGTSRLQLTATCSTGNCTWPITPTAGICSVCDDVKSQVRFSNTSSGPSKLAYTLPVGGYQSRSITVTLEPRNLFGLASLEPGNSSGLTANFLPGRQILTTVWALGVPPSKYPDLLHLGKLNQSDTDPLMVAYSCSLYFCLQAYNATSTDGIFEEKVVGSWDRMNESGPNPFHITNWEPGLPQPTWAFVDVPDSMNLANASAYVVDFQSRHVLAEAITTGIGGTVGLNGLNGMPTFQSFSNSSTSTNDAASVQALWMATNSTATMSSKIQAIADSFTAYMRTELAAPPDATYAPTTSRDAIFVVVRWPWFAYPLSLLLAGHLFFAATLFQTSRRAVRPWKSQRLPLLLAHIDDVAREFAAGGLHRRDGLEDRVGRMKVRMEFDGQDGLAFKRA